MDKSFINIDDLVKQRLVGGEEEPRSGAWSNMRDLLDKEMPRSVPGAAFSWRRMFTYAASVLAVATVGVGGYKMATAAHNTDANTTDNVASSTQSIAPNKLIADNSADNNITADNKINNSVADNTTGNKNRDNNNSGDNKLAALAAVTSAHNDANNNQGSKKENSNTINTITNKANDHKGYTTGSLNEQAIVIGQKDSKSVNNNRDKHSLASGSNTGEKADMPGTVAPQHDQKFALADNSNNAIDGSAKTAHTVRGGAKNSGDKIGAKATANTANANDIYNGAVANNAPRQRDVVIGTKLEVYKHYLKNNSVDDYRLDTISITNLVEQLNTKPNDEKMAAKNNPAMANNNTKQQAPIMPPVPQSGNENTKTGDEANKGDVAIKRNLHGQVSSSESMSATFNDIKYHVAAVQFSPGLIGGINGTFFGPNNFKGFQFGVTGNFLITKQWSIMGELKYMHRINNNLSITDNYNKYTLMPSTGMYEKDSTLRSFGFSTLHSFELPITVRYSHGKFNIFAGPNFVYSLAINTGGGDLPYINQGGPVYVKTPNTANSEPKLSASDFNARFGMGYILGVSYEVAPNFTIDFRNVQTIWDNANTPGESAVSHDLYKSPSLQLSLAYRLGSKD